MSGYVRIHRSLLGHPVFRHDGEAMAFAWLVVRAAWKPCRVRYKERTILLQRGQLAISQRDMGRALERDKAWVERFWKRLKNEAMIEASVEAGVAVISICNYDNYQHSDEGGEAATKAPREAGARQGRGTEQRREEVKKEANASSAWARPVGIDGQVWADFLTNRKKKRLPNTASSWKSFNDDLKRVAAETGKTPAWLIEYAAAKGWGGIYRPRDDDGPEARPKMNMPC